MPELFVGLMSGTSLDGIDCVIADLTSAPRLVHTRHDAFPPRLRETLLALNTPARNEIHTSALAANALADAYADTAAKLLADAGVRAADISAIGCHGQTVRHNPAEGYSVQLVNGARLAERAGIAVVCDFRSRDIAAGGEGAPLASAFHRAVFGSTPAGRVIVNVGGMANVTSLAPDGRAGGFDCGPGNALLDAWTAEHLRKPYDDGGAWAAQGTVLPEVLEALLIHPYFARRPPKSTGRETFNMDWLRQTLTGTERPVDVQATLLELTASAIAAAVEHDCGDSREVYVCGGGARNAVLLARLAALLPEWTVASTDVLGIEPEWIEALAFAWLAQRALKNEAGNMPAVTGARGSRVLGAIYPR